MNKRQAHHYWRKIRLLKAWYFFAAALVFGVIAVVSLRNNYEHMVTLRSAVYAADKNNGDVTTALNNLRSYVYAHMNTNLATSDGVYPPIQLKYTYDRLVQAENAEVSQTNSQLYTAAENSCQQQIPTGFSGRYRISCVTQYINDHGAKVQPIPDALYKFDFVSPTWSPDLAGWSIVLTILLLLLGGLTFILRRWLKV